MPRPVNDSGRYIAGLDGLRALAVIAVVAYHLGLEQTPGGLLGVGIFFTLSGYLITDLMLGERKRTGQIDMKRFWLRRGRRLLPAMLMMAAAVSGWLWMTDPSRLASLRGELAASLLYVSNWRFIFHEVSYFESFGPPSPIGHLWSLAVEEQFYLLWPLIVLLLLRMMPRRGLLAVCTIVLAAASAAAMAVIYEPGADPSRVYYGTDTRAFGMLIGAALACLWPSWKLANRTAVSRTRKFALEGIGAAGTAVIAVMIMTVGEYDPFLYQGGMVLLSVATAAVVAVIVHPASLTGTLFGWKPLRWVGVRSYGIYLWHYPVIVLSTPLVDTGDGHPLRSLLQLAATLLLAALSWRFVEEPIRHGALGRLWKRTAQLGGRMLRFPASAAAAGLLVMVLVSFIGVEKLLPEDAKAASSPVTEDSVIVEGHTASFGNENDWAHVGIHAEPSAAPSPPAAEATDQPPASGQQPGVSGGAKPESGSSASAEPPAESLPSPSPDGGQAEGELTGSETMPDQGGEASVPAGETDQPPEPTPSSGSSSDGIEAVRSGENMTAIGDSIMLDIEPNLSELLPGITVDGKIGRQFREAQDIIDEKLAKGELGDYVIIALGSNGAFSQKQFDKLLTSLQDVKQVLLVNTRVPRDWESTVNEMLASAEDDYDNVQVLDWHGASKGRDEYFAKDGVHLTQTGSSAYSSLIIDALD